MLSVQNLSVEIGGRKLIDKISFEIAPGECLGLTGPSGSGKSTVLRAIAGLTGYDGGIFFEGQDLKKRSRLERAYALNMVFQDPYGSLHPRHTVARALTEPLIVHGIENHPEHVLKAMADVGLSPDLSSHYPHQLSGGQRQRAVIARALMLRPKLLLLDEPTSALDMTVQADVLSLLERIRAEHGLSFLLVAHAAPIVARLCQRSLRMEKGLMEK